MNKKLIIGAFALAALSFGGGAYYGHCRLQHQKLPQLYQSFASRASGGDSSAKAIAGLMCAEELGCAYNPEQAHLYWQQAAEQNNPSAQYLAGYAYEIGLGTPRDYIKARTLYEQAAGQNHPLALRQLGYLYYYGHGVAEDQAKGQQFLQQAAERGDLEAKAFMQKNI
ncbi:MAG: tetratricopeptide repeat protein [bacterium]|nr:tetratricopeptide repeat protein [bacterium]